MRRTLHAFILPAALALLCLIPVARADQGEAAGSDMSRPVEAMLNALKKQSEQSVPPEVIEAGRKGTEELIRHGVE